jgi:hypothetical protein
MAEIIASVPDALEKMQALDLTNLSADQQSWITSTLASPSPVAQIVDFTEGLYSCGTALSADQQSLCAALAL